MQDHLKKHKCDESWLVIDRDSWPEEHIQLLVDWTKKQKQRNHLALSNPKFEYWLLLHYENGNKIGSSTECTKRLEKYIPGYNKKKIPKFELEQIKTAVGRAKKRDHPPCEDWPREMGKTTVYRLVESILNFAEKA